MNLVAARILSTVPCSIWERIAKPTLLLPYYHIVSDGEVYHTKHLYKHKTSRQFVDDLDFLVRRYNPVSLSEIIEHLAKRTLLPENAFHLTFDDGFREMADIVAPILSRKGIPATFFVNTAFIDNNEMCYLNKLSLIIERITRVLPVEAIARVLEIMNGNGSCLATGGDIKGAILSIGYEQRSIVDEIAGVIDFDWKDHLRRDAPYLTSDQVHGLVRGGFTIGAHSIDHPKYSTIPLEEQIDQTLGSLQTIRDTYGLSYGAFAFPHTDRGVSNDFFERIYQSGLIDVSFGTRGLSVDPWPRNLQRINFETPSWPAEQLVSYYCARQLFKRAAGAGELIR